MDEPEAAAGAARLYPCGDGVDIYIVMHGSGVLQRGLKLLGLTDTERFPPTMPAVDKYGPDADYVQGALQAFCMARTGQQVEEQLTEAGVPCSKVYTYDMAEADPHYQARGVFTEWDTVAGKPIKGVKVTPEFTKRPGQVWRGAPSVGMDNEMLLKELGLGDAEINDLYEAKVLAKGR